jgi:hypothetical protein
MQLSANTIHRTLKRIGFESRVRKKKPYLKKEHQQKRLAFAQKYKDWTIENWMRVVWSDESKFQIFGSDGIKYCWKKSGDPIRNVHIKPTMKFGGGSIMV